MMNLYTGTRKYLRLKCVHSVFTQASFFSISFKLIIFEYVFKNIAFECILQVMYIIQNLDKNRKNDRKETRFRTVSRSRS